MVSNAQQSLSIEFLFACAKSPVKAISSQANIGINGQRMGYLETCVLKYQFIVVDVCSGQNGRSHIRIT